MTLVEFINFRIKYIMNTNVTICLLKFAEKWNEYTSHGENHCMKKRKMNRNIKYKTKQDDEINLQYNILWYMVVDTVLTNHRRRKLELKKKEKMDTEKDKKGQQNRSQVFDKRVPLWLHFMQIHENVKK